MKIYEYSIAVIPSYLSSDKDGPYERIEAVLNSFGEEGWMLVEREGTEYLFMREVEEEASLLELTNSKEIKDKDAGHIEGTDQATDGG